MYESNDKMVSHPDHYQSETGLEVIDVIEAFTFDLKGIEATDTGNVLKYMCRWKSKNGLQDLEKAQWYLTHLIEHVKKLKEENEPYIPMHEDSDEPFRYGLIYETRCEAEEMLDFMLRIAKKCGVVTIADLCDLEEKPYNLIAEYIGWTEDDLQKAEVVKVMAGYEIFFHSVNLIKLNKEKESKEIWKKWIE